MDGYDLWVCKMGDVDTARRLFDMATVKDRGIWGAMISGYVQNNCFKEGASHVSFDAAD